jgi:hypothetical protein
MTITLNCNGTAFDDRFVTVVIKSLTFVGPSGLSAFP